MAAADATGGPVALVIQRRIRDEGFGDYARWQARVAERLRSWPGFLGQEVVPPAPPAHVDWTIVQRFADAGAARAWLQSEDRARLIGEIARHFVGQEDLHLLPDLQRRVPATTASAVISYQVRPEEEGEFLDWQGRIQAAEARFPGFRRHKIERPVPGLHEDWLIVLNFDSEARLQAWLDSAERRALLAEGGRFGRDIEVKHSNYGFDFWFPAPTPAAPDRPAIFRSNLLILLVLYPVVFLWGHFISTPLQEHGLPFWLTLFIGNLASTQILGWWLAPTAFRLFEWWRPGGNGVARQAAGYATLSALYALSMAACALLK